MAESQKQETPTTPLSNSIKNTSETLKNIISIIRDLAIVLSLVFVVFFTETLTEWMEGRFEYFDLGFTKILAANTKSEEAADAVDRMERAARKALEDVDTLALARPELSEELESIREGLQTVTERADAANTSLDSVTSSIQTALLKRTDYEGWVSSNLLDTKQRTAPGGISTVVGDKKLRIRSGPGQQFSRLTSLDVGTRVKVLEVRRGGPWVRVTTDTSD